MLLEKIKKIFETPPEEKPHGKAQIIKRGDDIKDFLQ